MYRITKKITVRGIIAVVFAVNASNMYISMGGIHDGKVIFSCRISTDRSKTDDEYAVMLKTFLTYIRSI